MPSSFNNNLKARSGQECWYCADKGLGACMDAETCPWVTYIPDGKNHTGRAIIKRENEVLKTLETGYNVPQVFQICMDFDGNDVWAGTSKGVGHGIGYGYNPRLRSATTAVARQQMDSTHGPALTPTLSHPMGEGAQRAGEGPSVAHPADHAVLQRLALLLGRICWESNARSRAVPRRTSAAAPRVGRRPTSPGSPDPPDPARRTADAVDGVSARSDAAMACLSDPTDSKPSAVNADMR